MLMFSLAGTYSWNIWKFVCEMANILCFDGNSIKMFKELVALERYSYGYGVKEWGKPQKYLGPKEKRNNRTNRKALESMQLWYLVDLLIERFIWYTWNRESLCIRRPRTSNYRPEISHTIEGIVIRSRHLVLKVESCSILKSASSDDESYNLK